MKITHTEIQTEITSIHNVINEVDKHIHAYINELEQLINGDHHFGDVLHPLLVQMVLETRNQMEDRLSNVMQESMTCLQSLYDEIEARDNENANEWT